MRREMAVPLPSTVNGEWADMIWASAMLVRGPMIATPPIVTTQHATSTSTNVIVNWKLFKACRVSLTRIGLSQSPA